MKLTSLLTGLLMVPVLLLSGCGDSEVKGNVLGNRVSITLPDGFTKMPEDVLKTKYPSAQRPSEAWYAAGENGRVSIAFSKTEQAMTESHLSGVADAMKTQLKAFSPKITEAKVKGKKVMIIEMKTPDAANPDGSDIINVMQLAAMDNKLLIVTFNVTEDLKDTYYQSGKTALSTLTW